ncbi:MAG: diguanylate cyclase, partial [bacterium]|nr:diguanylate cyclase [bacterium]
IMMPGMSGLDLLKLLRGTYSPTELPVIMVSAVDESRNVAAALDLGANDYVTKPVDFAVAMARVRSHLNQRRSEEALRASEERYALAARGTNDGLWDWDLVGHKVHYSPRWKSMLGYEEAEITEEPEQWLDRVHPEDADAFREQLNEFWLAPDKTDFACEHRIRHQDGEYRWILCRGTVLHDSGGDATRMAGSITDITSSKVFDYLTGLPNRIQFSERLQQALDQYHPDDPQTQFAVLFIDLDRFKVVNDSLGHLAGDQLLVEVAKRLKKVVRVAPREGSADLVARFGGDEFAVLLDALPNPHEATRVAHRLQTALCAP